MSKIKIALVGVGNCSSSLLQGIAYYRDKPPEQAIGLMNWEIGGYKPFDIEAVAAFDVDERKVGKDLADAIFAPPNCADIFCDAVPSTGTVVRMGKVLDGFSEHMGEFEAPSTFVLADEKEPDNGEVTETLKSSGAEILLNYLPVGSEKATQFYAECALDAGLGFINCIPVFIASNPDWACRFEKKNLPLVGDDIKGQIGATITHRALTDLFMKRGAKLDKTYQLNTGGNTDFMNMLNRDRLKFKKISKTDSIKSRLKGNGFMPENIHVGPSDYVSWQKDNKVAFIRMEGRIFGNLPINMEVRLSVPDSPNSAGVVVDAIRCCKLALERGEGGVLDGPSAYFMKRPARQLSDDEAFRLTRDFVSNHDFSN